MRVEVRPIDQVRPYPGNPRLNDKAVGPVAASIKEFGFQQPIVVDAAGVVIVGHTRLLAAKALQLTEVPVVVAANLTEEQVKAYRLADNRTNENAAWDWSLLGEEFRNLTDADFDLSLTAFDAEEIKKALHFDDGTHIRDYTPRDKPAPLTQPGWVWTSDDLEHVVACVENNSTEAVELLRRYPIDVIWTDPPYNMALTSVKGVVHNDTFATDKDFSLFLQKCFAPAVEALPGGHFVFTCGHHASYQATKDALTALGLDFKHQLIWVKPPSYALGHTFNKSHEVIWLYQKPGTRHLNGTVSPREELNDLLPPLEHLEKKTKAELLELYKKVVSHLDTTVTTREHDAWADHPTVKPTTLIGQHLSRTSYPGDRVVDLFGGSGSTAVTCFGMGRKSLTFELDPSYVDVACTRIYERYGVDFTNQHGVKFSALWLPEKKRREEEEQGDA